MRSPARFLEKAHLLIGSAKDEEDRAIAVDTLYYAVYYAVCDFVGQDIGASNKNHDRVYNLLFAKTDVQISKRFRLLKRLRVTAKYKLQDEITAVDVKEASAHAQAVLNAIRATTLAATSSASAAPATPMRVVPLRKGQG